MELFTVPTMTFKGHSKSSEMSSFIKSPELSVTDRKISLHQSWTWVGSIHGSSGLGRVKSQNYPSRVGRVESGAVLKISNKYTIYTQETDYSTTIIHNNKNL